MWIGHSCVLNHHIQELGTHLTWQTQESLFVLQVSVVFSHSKTYPNSYSFEWHFAVHYLIQKSTQKTHQAIKSKARHFFKRKLFLSIILHLCFHLPPHTVCQMFLANSCCNNYCLFPSCKYRYLQIRIEGMSDTPYLLQCLKSFDLQKGHTFIDKQTSVVRHVGFRSWEVWL